MSKTKHKIIEAAISLFNDRGLSNVRNQDIAEKAGISVSNFNYHFKTKQDLVFAVIDHMVEVLENKVYGNKMLMQESNGMEMSKSYFEYEYAYRFFYLDTHNILNTYPEIKERMQYRLKEAMQIIKNLNYISIGRGVMKPEPEDMPGLYDKLAEQIWVNNHFWFAQAHIRGIKENLVQKGMESSFALIYPYLTDKGKKIYSDFIQTLKEDIAKNTLTD